MMGNRSRLYFRDIAGGAALSFTGFPPWNSTLIQIGIHYSAAVTSPGLFTIRKSSITLVDHNYSIYSDDPSFDGKISDLYLCDIEFKFRDAFFAAYANPDAVTVALEIVFREAQ